jgi:hypothetical protein
LRVISRASFRRNSDTQFVTPAIEVAIVTGLGGLLCWQISLCRGQGKRTMREAEVQIGNSG